MTRVGYVYALRLTVPGRRCIYVVGSTANTVAQRLESYFDPHRSHGHIANLVRRIGRRGVKVATQRRVNYTDNAQLEVAERALARRWRERGLHVLSDQ